MEFDVTREQWIDRFALHLSQLEVGAIPEDFLELAARRWGTRGQIDAETAAHLWAERYDRKMEDIFAIQDEISRIIATTRSRSWR